MRKIKSIHLADICLPDYCHRSYDLCVPLLPYNDAEELLEAIIDTEPDVDLDLDALTTQLNTFNYNWIQNVFREVCRDNDVNPEDENAAQEIESNMYFDGGYDD